jgi:hypothetical protein
VSAATQAESSVEPQDELKCFTVLLLEVFQPRPHENFSSAGCVCGLPFSPPLFDCHASIWHGVKIMNVSLHNSLLPPVTSFHLDPDVFLSTLFPDTLSLSPLHDVRISHTSNTIGKILASYIVVFMFADNRQEDGLNGGKHCLNVMCCLLSS